MIGEVVIYILKVVLIQGAFILLYRSLLQYRTHYGLNRVYLLSTLLISLVIPFIQNPFPDRPDPILDETVMSLLAEPVYTFQVSEVSEPVTPAVSYWKYILVGYFLIVGFFFTRSAIHLVILQRIKKRCEYIKKQWFKLFKTSHSRPFSFFSSVFIPNQIFGTDYFDQILAHECVHVKQMHSLDRLLVDFLVALFWFNPFIYIYRNALIEVHEYQADAAVIDQYKDPIGYQEVLYAQLQPAGYSGLVSHFNFSTIKKRIVMMNKVKNSGQSKLAYLITLPVVAFVIFSFTTKESTESVASIADQIESVTGPFEVSNVISEIEIADQDDKFTPTLLPLKTTSKFKVSSSFGPRKNPHTGEKQKHFGIDLACPVGTEVIATADGVVSELQDSSDGYGKMLALTHGDEFKTRYAQLSEFKVQSGDKVKKGQVIALTGNSGKSTGPHLHYEVYQNDKRVNPVDFINNYKFAEIYEVSTPSKVVAKPKVKEVKNLPVIREVDLNSEKNRKVKEEKLVKAEIAKVAAEKIAAEAEKRMKVAEVRMAEMEEKMVVAERVMKEAEEKMIQIERLNEDKDLVQRIVIRESKNGDDDVQPLVILDGKEIERDVLVELDPNQIHSINVYKDGKAIEKFGSKGKDGVVEIYTLGKTKQKTKSKNKNK